MSPVPVDDPIAPLIPWYANGTLEAAERERVERHLPDCPSCYGLLVHARSFRRRASNRSQAELFDHVEGHLLVQYAEEPDRLDADTRRFVSIHLGGCDVCAGGLEILQEMSQALIAAHTAGGARAAARGWTGRLAGAVLDFWRNMTRTILRPVPALAYLGALLLVLAAVALSQPGQLPDGGPGVAPPEAITVLPPAIRLPEEILMRGDGERPAPQEFTLPVGAGPVVLELITSIDLDDLADPDTTFRLEVTAGDRVVHRALLRGADFDRRGRLQLGLDPSAFEAGGTYEIRLSLDRDGDPRDGEPVYGKSFRLSPAASS